MIHRFLAYQNKNGVAEWSKLGVTTLIEGLLQQVFNILAVIARFLCVLVVN